MDKSRAIAQLQDVLGQWRDFLAGLSEQQITAERLPEGLSVKDVIAHLRTWQTLSIERLEAALAGKAPTYAGWPQGIHPDDPTHRDRINAWILHNHRDWSWPDVHRLWLVGFHRFIDLAQRFSDADLNDAAKYRWLDGWKLIDVLTGSYEHHKIDHLDTLKDWLSKHPNALNN